MDKDLPVMECNNFFYVSYVAVTSVPPPVCCDNHSTNSKTATN